MAGRLEDTRLLSEIPDDSVDAAAFTVWLTGLPSSGKGELAEHIAARLRARGLEVEVLDSRKLTRGPLRASAAFSPSQREASARLCGLAARLLTRHGVVAVVSAVSPYRAVRNQLRQHLGRFVEVHVATPKEACIARDAAGNWQRALRGELRGFTGVDDPYEPPLSPEVRVDLSSTGIEMAVGAVMSGLERLGCLEQAGARAASAAEDRDLVGLRLQELGYLE